MLVIWRFYDGKPGHDRQSRGLIRALAAATPVNALDFDARKCSLSVWAFLSRKLPYGDGAPAPDLLIGAGRRCQWPLVAARRARGGNAVILMKPHLPGRCFDLCLIPRHDWPSRKPRYIHTEGVLNDIAMPASHGKEGLVLIGGPSSHYAWDEAALTDQIANIIAADPDKSWVIADSRRTPPATAVALAHLCKENVTWMPVQASPQGWLTAQFGRSDIVWVSADSVSMMYEALTAGAAVGVLEVPAKRDDRITAIVPDLVRRGMITPYTRWLTGTQPRASSPLAEAARCAAIILSRWDPTSRSLRTMDAE